MLQLQSWLEIRKEGLYCLPGQFYVDPISPVDRAIITHAHADHARSGHRELIAEQNTVELMQLRFGQDCANQFIPLQYQQKISLNKTQIYLLPAGHILGSAQIVIEYQDLRLIISGDYKRAFDPTCPSFIVENCDIFIIEATFALPVFKHPPIEVEIQKLLTSVQTFPERCHLVGVYALGKCQRLIKSLRQQGFLEPIYLHGALIRICDFYKKKGMDLGELIPATELDIKSSEGKIVLCPPSALREKWSRRFTKVLPALASGWMQIRARAKQLGVELPLIISDHADWLELTKTIEEIKPKELWVTHGREEALVYYANQQGFKAEALHLLGYDEARD